MTDQQRAIDEFLRRVEEAERNGESFVAFTREEAEALHSIARFWRAGESVGWLAGRLAGFTGYLAIAVAGWVAFKAGFFEFIREGLGK